MRRFRFFDLLNPAIMFLWAYIYFLGFYAILVSISPSWIPLSEQIFLSKETGIALIMYPLCFIFSAYLLSNIVLLRKPKVTSSQLYFDIHPKKVFYGIFTLFLIAFVIFLLIYMKIGFIPLLQENSEEVRVEAKRGLGTFILLATGMVYVTQLFSYAYLRFFSRYKRFLIYCISLVSFCLVLGIGYRGPAFMIFLIIIFVKYFLFGKQLNFQSLMKFLFYAFSLMIIISLIGYYRNTGILDFNRITIPLIWTMIVNLLNFQHIVEYFQYHPYRYGMTMVQDFLVAIPGIKSQFFGNELKNLLMLSFRGEGVTVTAPGEGYANFGLIGVAIHALIFGLLVGISFSILNRSQKITIRLLLIILTLNFWRVAAGGFTPMFFFSLAPTLIVYFVFVIILKYGKL